jgi:hypothetical protein
MACRRPFRHQVPSYDRAVRLMRTSAAGAFDLDDEPQKLRDRYGANRFGQGCLLVRRLTLSSLEFGPAAGFAQ